MAIVWCYAFPVLIQLQKEDLCKLILKRLCSGYAHFGLHFTFLRVNSIRGSIFYSMLHNFYFPFCSSVTLRAHLNRQKITKEASSATREMPRPINSRVRVLSAISIFIWEKRQKKRDKTFSEFRRDEEKINISDRITFIARDYGDFAQNIWWNFIGRCVVIILSRLDINILERKGETKKTVER